MKTFKYFLFLIFLFQPNGYTWWSAWIFQDSTHYKITEHAIKLLPENEYKDIHRFKKTIIKATSGPWDDENAHGREFRDDAIKFNGGPFKDWWEGFPYSSLTLYKNFQFAGRFNAYYRIGLMAHLVQDQAVPAHAANIYHGGLLNWDDLESFSKDLSPIGNYVNYYGKEPLRYYYDAKFQDDSIIYQTQSRLPFWKYPESLPNQPVNPAYKDLQFWIANPNAPYVGGAFEGSLTDTGWTGGWGRYGGPLSDAFPNGEDIYQYEIENMYYCANPAIAQFQMNEAVAHTAGLLKAVSESLPPLANFKMPEEFTVNFTKGVPITFDIQENRTSDVKISLIVQESSQAIITDGATISLSSFLSKDGLSQSESLSGNITWSTKTISLFDTKKIDLSILPKMAEVKITWKGDVEGKALEPRNEPYTLVLKVEDADGNFSDEKQIKFTVPIDTIPPTISWQEWQFPVGKMVPLHLIDVSRYLTLYTGEITGSNTIEDAPWLQLVGAEKADTTYNYVTYQHTSSETFSARISFKDSGSGTNSFAIYFPNKTEPEIKGTISDGENLLLTSMMLKEDGTGYMLTASDRFLNTTTMYFHLDRESPRLTISSITINKIPGNFNATFHTITTDNMSGLTAISTSSIEAMYALQYQGPYWPPGPQTETSSITLGPEGGSQDYFIYVFDRSGLINMHYARLTYSTDDKKMFASGQGEWKRGLEKWPYASYMLDKITFNTTLPPLIPPLGCTRLNDPVGMHTEFIIETYQPTQDELDWYNTLASGLYAPIIKDQETMSLPKKWDIYNVGLFSEYVDEAFPTWVKFRIKNYGNTNNVYMQCTNPDGSSFKTTFKYPNSVFFETKVTMNTKLLSIGHLIDYPEILVVPGFNVKVVSENVEIVFSSITIGGQLFISKTKLHPEVPWYRIYEDGSYNIITTAKAENVKVRVRLPTNILTSSQTANARMYHYDAITQTWKEITIARGPDYVEGLSATVSPFVVMVPIDDITPPKTSHMIYGEMFGPFISTETYIALQAEDTAFIGDALGVAKINYIVDPQVDEATCRATPYDPNAPSGTCANPVYTEPFTLNEGTHTIIYFSQDKANNEEKAKVLVINADGTPPITEVRVEGIGERVEEKIYITQTDTITLVAHDPVSNNVASNVREIKYVINPQVPIEECFSAPFVPEAPPGTCENPIYPQQPFILPIGTHTIYYFSIDNVGNAEQIKSVNIIVKPFDTEPPVTTIIIDEPKYVTEVSTYVTGKTTFSLFAVDLPAVGGTGVKFTEFQVDSGSWTLYTFPFTLNKIFGIPETPIVPEGVVSYWKFDEGSGITAFDSVDANHGTLMNGLAWTEGKVGNAVRLFGFKNHVDLGLAPAIDSVESGDFTYEFWFRTTSTKFGFIYMSANVEVPYFYGDGNIVQLFIDNSGAFGALAACGGIL